MGYSAREIYHFARLAGFQPNQAATMTAIALAESGGDPHAHNASGENSKGLWQINAAAHKWTAGKDLYDPVVNAEAAFKVSHGGNDISPWTVTHGGPSARYLRYQEKAQAAAVAAGDGTGLGMWSGVSGYGDHTSAAGDGGVPGTGSPDRLQTFLQEALAQTGDRYVFGAEASISNPNPRSFDCSELTQWAAGRAGVTLRDGASQQYLDMKDAGTLIPVDQAISTPGALLFRFSEEPTPGGGRPTKAHVAISLGDGRTIEAKGTKYGVGSFDAEDGGFQYAAVVPGLAPTPGMGTDQFALTAMTLSGDGTDSDRDGLTDALEVKLQLDPDSVDTDKDNFSDFFELTKTKTNPLLADTDLDSVADATEVALGLNPLSPDSNLDGHLDAMPGAPASAVLDADHDRLDDDLEKLLRTNAASADSDLDGFTDGAEHQGGFDPLNALSNPLADPLGSAGLGGLAGAGDALGGGVGATGAVPGSISSINTQASVHELLS
jgi:cell wall-associated NlpC family hydrolase